MKHHVTAIITMINGFISFHSFISTASLYSLLKSILRNYIVVGCNYGVAEGVRDSYGVIVVVAGFV